jgi:thioredoxin-dependent peroxiredoxin
VRDEIAKFKAADIQPFGVNPAGLESHKSYIEKFQFNFPLLSDPDRAIASAYHALKDDGR